MKWMKSAAALLMALLLLPTAASAQSLYKATDPESGWSPPRRKPGSPKCPS